MAEEIITRRRLPHWYVPGAMHFVTYRLAGTLPASVIRQFRARKNQMLRQKPRPGVSVSQYRERIHKQAFGWYGDYLDRVCRIDWLARHDVATIIRGNLYHHNGTKYYLLAYCIMPNHVHVLLQPIEHASTQAACSTGEWLEDAKSPLSKIMHSLKSYTANKANEVLGRSGAFWQRESYDHWVRDDEELERIIQYICANPVSAHLVENPEDWLFSSSHDRYAQDGNTEGWLLS